MNIEEVNDNLIMLKYFLQEEGDEYSEKYCKAIETLLTAYEKEKEKNKEHKEKIIYWLDRLDLEETLQDEYDGLYGCQAAVKILKQLLKEE